jgi:vanillate O-demethylase ferredoxin subunit
MKLRIDDVRILADGIKAFRLVDPGGAELPEFSPGAHVDLRLGNGLIRQYSLCGDPADRHGYMLGVLREAAGGGGSRYIHDELGVGSMVETSAPRNNFKLVAAPRYLFVAGGIGVTPILPMLRAARRSGADFRLFYCTRSPARTAFREELLAEGGDGSVVIHHDGGDPARGLDFAALLAAREPGTQLYYCGPPGLMTAIAAACRHWPADAVHCEHFSARLEEAGVETPPNRAFRVRIAESGVEYEVPADQTIVNVLRRNGVTVDTSCEDGYCGTCMTRYTAGEPEHRDTVLDAESRRSYVLICCARSKTPVLELDM